MDEARRLGRRTKTVILIGILALLGLAIAFATVGRERMLERRVATALANTTTKPDFLADNGAWMAARAGVFRVTDHHTLEVEEIWFCDAPTAEVPPFPDYLATDERRQLRDERSDGRLIPLSRLVQLSVSDSAETEGIDRGGIALIESDSVYEYDGGYRGAGTSVERPGVFSRGKLSDVKARAIHVHELWRVFEEVKARKRVDLLEPLLRGHVWSLRGAVLKELGKFPQEALPILHRFLADDEQLDGRDDAVEALAMLGCDEGPAELTLVLERELAYWTRPRGVDDSKEARRVLSWHIDATRRSLYHLEYHCKDRRCREPVERFLDLEKTLAHGDTYLADTCASIRSDLGIR